jgi:hypothetical protein
VRDVEVSNKKLRWLDVSRKYLNEDGTSLNPDLVFDGTHMAPTFMQYVSAALEDMV